MNHTIQFSITKH